MLWSTTVEDFHPVHPKPKWGYTAPPQPQVEQALAAKLPAYLATLRSFFEHKDLLHGIPQYLVDEHVVPYWNNGWFSTLDAASLVCFLALRRPSLYLEIGSGFSTRFARHAIGRAGTGTRLVSIDPEPRVAVDGLCDALMRTTLEDCPPAIFDELMAGDILFFDGSHRVFTNSDVTVFFFDILPRLRAGVLIHVHDVFLPFDYPESWNNRLYSEQYLLAAMLLCRERPFEVVLPNRYLFSQPNTLRVVSSLFHGGPGKGDIPLTYNNGHDTPAVSFWIEKV